MTTLLSLAALALVVRSVHAQSCISLAGSTACPAFNSSSISTDSTLVGFYPFLAYVTSTAEFDIQISRYVTREYVQTKYISIFGCDNVNLGNTSSYYARYTTSFLCNGIVQNSKAACGLSADDSQPLCADSCAELALSEEQIVSSNLCSGRDDQYADQLRADFTNCALPANSISGSCIAGESNEPNDCGFAGNLMGLCNFCRDSPFNGTDSCCLTSNATGRCQDVTLPVFSTISNLFSPTTSPTSSPTSSSTTAASHQGGGGLSGGAIAGIVVGSVVGFLLLLAAIALCFICLRKRRSNSKAGSVLNQPSPQRRGVASASYNQPMSQQGYEVLPGGRVARMSALQDDQAGGNGPVVGPRNYTSHTDPYGDSPESREKTLGAAGVIKANGSPGSDSQQGSSPGDFSSPEGVASGQSEQLPFFKDYYSNDDIHPGDKVSVLWAYQPRAGDEFELERGDMLKVVGIWDDGWATGVRINDRAEDYDGKHKVQRDSGVSNGSAARDESPTPSGEIKAFPLVCVCLPEAWKKTVEGDTSTEGGSAVAPPI
ncbi:SH3 domain containing protein [Cladophialophora carrionii]|uniref:SH3 domain containing protein n=1 Tax=Cladophialophora carrionii TaxID=86049 RepID=A0A1C1C8C3_9EURO|nr:SH3 domain containing protein [Cladophialophora carrionii]